MSSWCLIWRTRYEPKSIYPTAWLLLLSQWVVERPLEKVEETAKGAEEIIGEAVATGAAEMVAETANKIDQVINKERHLHDRGVHGVVH
jgi:hypothetical protein